MSAVEAVVQVWSCVRCGKSYPSPLVLTVAPTHHCPSPVASRVRPFTLEVQS